MQRDGNTLAHVLLMYANLYRHFEKIRLRGDYYVEANIQGDSLFRIIEKRQCKEEPHMFFLGFCVHPAFSKTVSSFLHEAVQVQGTLRRNRNPFSAK